jgi:endo-1,4-beta-xylanase
MFHAAAILLSAAVQESWVNPPKDPVPGVLHRTFMSASMKREVGYQIYLPPGYEGSDLRFPVIYFLHGMTDCETTHPHLFPILDAAVRSGEVKPAILVYTMCGRTSWYADAPDGSVMGESVFIKDLIPHVDATYRTVAAKGGRALQGWSMGGHGAIKFAFKYPELFSSAVAYGGGFRRGEQLKDRGGKLLQTMFGGDSARFDAESPAGLLAAKGPALKGQLALRLVVGEKDFLLEDNRRFKGLLEAQGVAFEYEEIPATGHEPKKVFEAQGLQAHRFSAAGFAK